MNRIDKLFEKKKSKVLNIYYTAGFPQKNSTLVIAETLQKSGVDILEIGIPFSDPLADGPIIQKSSEIALKNGMTLLFLFEQLKSLREKITIPVLFMGYLNPILQMGMENFLQHCQKIGIDGVILPDLPIAEYQQNYQAIFEKYGIYSIFLITPATNEQRRQQIDKVSKGFLYIVSAASTTGTKKEHSQEQENYFESIKNAAFKNPTLIGFNIKDRSSFTKANQYANGGIIGSAFIQTLLNSNPENLNQLITEFIQKIQ